MNKAVSFISLGVALGLMLASGIVLGAPYLGVQAFEGLWSEFVALADAPGLDRGRAGPATASSVGACPDGAAAAAVTADPPNALRADWLASSESRGKAGTAWWAAASMGTRTDAAAPPQPETLALLGTGLIGCWAAGRLRLRRRRRTL